jgi:hypothetical protein
VFTDTVAARVVESADGLSLGAWTPPPPHGGTVGAAETEQRARWTRDVELRAPIQRAPGASGRLLVEVDHQTCVADRCWPVRSTRHELFVTPPR